jgi:vancomycin resistance protein YoaR
MGSKTRQQKQKTGLRQARLWLPLGFVAIGGGLLILLLFVVLAFQLLFLHRAYPGITVAGTPVGGMTRAEVMALTNGLAGDHLNKTITIRVDDQAWTFTGQELGIQIDAAATADLVFKIGRQGNLLTDMITQLSMLKAPQDVEPVLRYDTGPTNQALQTLRDAIDYPPQDARLNIESGVVEVTLSQRGRRIHLDSIRPLIEAGLFDRGPQEIEAITQQVLPNIDTQDLAGVQNQARGLLNKPFAFRLTTDAKPTQWVIEPAEFGTLLQITEAVDDSGKLRVRLQLNHDKLAPYITRLEEDINKDAVDARLFFNMETEELEVLQESKDGFKLDIPTLHQKMDVAVINGSDHIDLPVQLITPTIASDNLPALGITALVSEQTSYFSGSSSGRMSNIALAASKFDGVIIPPGEVFSFNEQLGPVTEEEGYDESLIIYGDRTTVGIGGGVCQVSTTAFRTAFFGGLEITERWAHGYRVSWYETNSVPGLDATIYTPDVDLKFRNDTGNYLLIQTETDLDAGTVTFRFFGTPTGWDIIVDEPVIENISVPPPPRYEQVATLPRGTVKQVDWAKDGMDVTVTRVVKQGEEIIHNDTVISRYRPWQAVYQVGPGTYIPQPSPTPPPPRVGRP